LSAGVASAGSDRAATSKPVLFVTGHVPSYRVGALARLHEREGLEVALFGGGRRHGGPDPRGELPFPSRRVGPRELYSLAAGGDYRAVVCPTGGRAALLASWTGARAGHVPLILWASLWAHPRTPAHLFSYLPLRRLYRSADAVVTYGPHVSAYVRSRGARNVFEAPQAVDNAFWSAPGVAEPQLPNWPDRASARFVFVGRPAREKGLSVLLEAWARAGPPPSCALVLVGAGAEGGASGGGSVAAGAVRPDGEVSVRGLGALGPERLREVYAHADVLVVPSIATAGFREPWGLVVNEAMDGGLAVIASDAVGAAAGGLVRDGDTGIVVAAGDAGALAEAIGRLAAAPELRSRLGAAGAEAVAAYTYDAWAQGFAQALASVGVAAR
jgi:glycosyltransferase involved in cell wall biosynthesis